MSFRGVNFTRNELLSEPKTDQLGENADWLYRYTPKAIYTVPGGIIRTEGLKIASGRVLIAKRNSDVATAQVRFGNFFSTNCNPNITTGIVSNSQKKIHATINGIGQLVPDHRGFDVHINIANELKAWDKITGSFYVTWQAMGY